MEKIWISSRYGYIVKKETGKEFHCWLKTFDNGTSIAVSGTPDSVVDEAQRQLELPDLEGPYTILCYTHFAFFFYGTKRRRIL